MTELWKFMVLERNHVLHGLAWWLWCMAVKEGSWAFRRQLNDLHSHDWSRLSIPGFAHAMSWHFHKVIKPENEPPSWIFVFADKMTKWGRSGHLYRVKGPILPIDGLRSKGFHRRGAPESQDPAWADLSFMEVVVSILALIIATYLSNCDDRRRQHQRACISLQTSAIEA